MSFELRQRLDGPGDDRFSAAAEMEAAQDRMQGNIGKARPGVRQYVDQARMRAGR